MLIEQARKIKKPIDRLVYWITERERIRIKKDVEKAAPPFTDDEILSSFRFCNVCRIEDKVSQWLLHNWYKPYFNHPNMLYACAIARFFNQPEALKLITKYVFGSTGLRQGQVNRIKEVLRAYRDKGGKIWNAAYMVRGNDGEDKVALVMEYTISPLRDSKVMYNSDSMEVSHAALSSCYGFGSFMAGQVVADLRHAVDGVWFDRKHWAPKGPGSQKGMNIIHGRDLKFNIPQEQFAGELMELRNKLFNELPEALTDRMEMIDYQNTLCEISKYEKALWGQGRPKQRYNPSEVVQ